MRKALVLLLFLPAGLLAGGCLQSSKDRYIADLKPLNNRLVKVNDQMVETISTASTRSPRRFAAELTPLSGQLITLSRQIGDLDTPEDLRQESAALTRSLDTTGAGANRTATFARRADARALTRATMDLADEVNRVIKANRRLAKATGAAG